MSMHRSRRAFTLMELLVVIGIIAVLVSLIIVALRGVRSAANRTDAMNSLRQLMAAHIGYSGDNDQRLLPGYLDEATLTSLGIKAELETEVTLGQTDAGSYVWRLAPYLDFNWQSLMTDYRSQQVEAAMDNEYNAGTYGRGTVGGGSLDFGIGELPSFGLNSLFVGGDTSHGGAYATSAHPWQTTNPKIAATRVSEVKNPSKLIVFGTTGLASAAYGSLPNSPPAQDLALGYCELRPPHLERDNAGNWVDQQWSIVSGGVYDYSSAPGGAYGFGGGVPVARWGDDLVPTATLDGSTHIEDRFQLGVDMSRWWPFATGVR